MRSALQLIRRRSVVLILLTFVVLVGGELGRRLWTANKISNLQSECRSAKVQQDWDRLAAKSAELVELDPISGQGWAMRALASQELGDLPTAALFLEKIPDGDKLAIPAFIELSGLYFETLRKPLEGERICKRILHINPEIVAAHQRLTHFYAMTLQRQLAIEQVRESIRQGAESVSTYCYFVTLPDLVFDDAVKRVDSWIEVVPDDPRLQISKALLRARDDSVKSGNDFEKKVFEELLELHQQYPNDLEVLTTLLEIKSREGDRDAVGQFLEVAPAAAAADHRMWRIRSWYSQSGGDLKLAEENLRESLRLFPMDWHSWQQLGGILRLANRAEEAQQAQELAKFGKDLQAVLLNLLTPENPPKEALEGILEYAIACKDEFVTEKLSRRLGRTLSRSREN